MYTSRLEEDNNDDDENLPDTDYNVAMEVLRAKEKREFEEQKRLQNMTAEEREAAGEMYKRNLVKCPHCLTVLGRRDILGNDYDYVIRDHESECYQAQEAKKEKDSLRNIQQEAIAKIISVCHNSNSYNRAQYSFEMQPAPHHMDKSPDSEEYKFERDWNEKKLTEQSDRLVYAWEDLIKFRDSSEEAKYAVNFYWKQQVSTYIDKYDLKKYRMKSFQIP